MSVSGVSSSGSDSTVLTADELLAKVKQQIAGKDDAKDTSGILSAKDLLQRAKDKASGLTVAPLPKDTVAISSRVQKILDAQAAQKTKSGGSFEDQDWYIKAKVSQLKGQIALYATLPGLDPGGNIMDSLTKEVSALAKKQQAKIDAVQQKAADAQKKLADAKANTYSGLSANQLIQKASGQYVEPPSSSVTDLLKQVQKEVTARGGSVNTTA